MNPKLAKRLLYGSLLIGLLAVGVWFDLRRSSQGLEVLAAPLLAALFILPALHELTKILEQAGMPVPRRLLFWAAVVQIAGKAHLCFHQVEHAGAWFLLLVSCQLVVVSWFLLREQDLKSGAARAAGSVLALVLVALLTTMIDVADRWGTSTLLALVLTAKSGDSGAFVVGKTLGRRKLIEHISPNKTVEGALGGVAASLLVGWWLFTWLGGGRWTTVEILLIAALVNVAGQVGDLLESLWKRSAGVKDSGHLLPEFGGALDLVDSLFLSMPVGLALLEILDG